jgi:hypothetical protein
MPRRKRSADTRVGVCFRISVQEKLIRVHEGDVGDW